MTRFDDGVRRLTRIGTTSRRSLVGVALGGLLAAVLGSRQAQAAPAEHYRDVGCYDYPVDDGWHQYCYDFKGVSVQRQTPSGNAIYVDNGTGRVTVRADDTVVEDLTGTHHVTVLVTKGQLHVERDLYREVTTFPDGRTCTARYTGLYANGETRRWFQHEGCSSA
jgi:hypothetical protein